MVENAIDANADQITISIDPENNFISVSDNGDGLTEEDLQMIGVRYGNLF